MGLVKNETKLYFPDGFTWVLYDAGDEPDGYCIEVVSEDGFDGELHTIATWTFGDGEDAHDIWTRWGDYVSDRFEEVEGDTEARQKLIDELDKIECDANEPKLKHLSDVISIMFIVMNHMTREG